MKDEYEILAADPAVLRAIKNASRGPIPARMEKYTLRLSGLGLDFGPRRGASGTGVTSSVIAWGQSWDHITADFKLNWFIYLSMPLVAAFMGYSTKLVALQMLYRPIEFVGIGPIGGREWFRGAPAKLPR